MFQTLPEQTVTPIPEAKPPLVIDKDTLILVAIYGGVLLHILIVFFWVPYIRKERFIETMRNTQVILDLLGEDAAKAYLQRNTTP